MPRKVADEAWKYAMPGSKTAIPIRHARTRSVRRHDWRKAVLNALRGRLDGSTRGGDEEPKMIGTINQQCPFKTDFVS